MTKQFKTILTIILAIAVIWWIAANWAQGATGTNWTQRQNAMHEIAELARSMGLPEDSPIILEAQRLWREDDGVQDDIRTVATVMYYEEGRDIACADDLTAEKEEKIMLVGKTIYNRVRHPQFPSTVYDVVVAPAQYLTAYANGGYKVPDGALAIFEDLARRVLAGEPFDCPDNVVYADTRTHGSGVYKSFYNPALRTTTYFCFA